MEAQVDYYISGVLGDTVLMADGAVAVVVVWSFQGISLLFQSQQKHLKVFSCILLYVYLGLSKDF